MKIKKIIIFALLLICLISTSCSRNTISESAEKGISISYLKDSIIEETDNYISITDKDDKINMIITVTDIYESISDEYKDILDIPKLNIQSGAFDSTYNNYVYVGSLFNYLIEGNAYELSPLWVDKTKFGTEDYFAYYAPLKGKDNCGYIYETVQNAKLYVICIYINDTYDVILDYSEDVNTLLDGLTFTYSES